MNLNLYELVELEPLNYWQTLSIFFIKSRDGYKRNPIKTKLILTKTTLHKDTITTKINDTERGGKKKITLRVPNKTLELPWNNHLIHIVLQWIMIKYTCKYRSMNWGVLKHVKTIEVSSWVDFSINHAIKVWILMVGMEMRRPPCNLDLNPIYFAWLC